MGRLTMSETTGSAGLRGRAIRVVLFDWGDTLMVDHRIDGPMAEWPQVEAVPGAAAVLEGLEGRYLTCVATNADDSGAELVEEALSRVGLAGHIRRVYSSRDIGARKPDPAFYDAVLRDLSGLVAKDGGPLQPDQVVMVGDSYANDVAGARGAGLRTVWFNREGGSSPTQPAPAYDAQIRSLDELPAALTRLQSA